jgi:hypothetical protein
MIHMDLPLDWDSRNAATWLELSQVALVAAAAEHKKMEVPPEGLVEIGTEIRWVPATVIDVAGDAEAGLGNFAVAPVKPEEVDPEAEVAVAEEVGAFPEFASAAEEVQDSVLALAFVDAGKARPVPANADADAEDAWVALAFGTVDVAGAWPEAAEGAAGAIDVQRVEAAVAMTAVERPELLEYVELPHCSQPNLALEEQEELLWSQRWESRRPVGQFHASHWAVAFQASPAPQQFPACHESPAHFVEPLESCSPKTSTFHQLHQSCQQHRP